MSPTCPKCGTVADQGDERTYVVETRHGRRHITVPQVWRIRSDRANNGETFAVEFEDDHGDLALRVQDVTIFYRDDASVKSPEQPRPIPSRDRGPVGAAW